MSRNEFRCRLQLVFERRAGAKTHMEGPRDGLGDGTDATYGTHVTDYFSSSKFEAFFFGGTFGPDQSAITFHPRGMYPAAKALHLLDSGS
jgi:hypothetical protein